MPLYATPFTAGLIAGKLEEEGLTGQVKLNVIERDATFDLGPFELTYVALAHSIPEGNGLLIETPYGSIFHTGDWKIDETPVLGEPSSHEALEQIGDEGVLALVCNSTNVFQDEASGSRGGRSRGASHRSRASARGRVLVTTFASNAARLQTIGRVANETGRQVCIAGPLARPDRAGREGDRLSRWTFPRRSTSTTAMRLPRERGADHRDRRAGRAARRARPHCVRQSRPEADRRRHGHLLARRSSPATKSPSAAS